MPPAREACGASPTGEPPSEDNSVRGSDGVPFRERQISGGNLSLPRTGNPGIRKTAQLPHDITVFGEKVNKRRGGTLVRTKVPLPPDTLGRTRKSTRKQTIAQVPKKHALGTRGRPKGGPRLPKMMPKASTMPSESAPGASFTEKWRYSRNPIKTDV